MSRKLLISECDPRRVEGGGVSFHCPESDGGCESRHAIPGGRGWTVSGELDDLTITPSIKCRGACQMHITITSGYITFHSDSKSGPDWSENS